MAICVIAVVGLAPCQCLSPGGNQITSPGRISSMGPPSRCTRPAPAVTISVWPSGWVCQAVRAPGSNVTAAPATRAGVGAVNSGSMRTVPVNQSAGPLPEGFEPLRAISIARGPLVVSETSIGHFARCAATCRPSEQLVRRDRQFADALASRVVDGVRDRRSDAHHGDLADALHAERVHVRVVLL